MSTALKTHISLRKDELSNWISKNPILNNGELAIVVNSDGSENIKLGNGLSTFSQLPFLYQSGLSTENITAKTINAKSISQGYHTKSTPTSFATGIFTEANGNFGVVHGIESRIKSSDDYAFVFNGENLPLDGENFYESHGEGTFNINPLSGLSGFYIGEKNAAEYLESVDVKISAESDKNVKLSSDSTQQLSTNLEMQGFLKVGGITVQGRKFVEIATSLLPIAEQSETRIGQAYMMIGTDYVQHHLQGHIYLLTTDISGNMEYKDITDLNAMSATYRSDIQNLTIDSHVGSAVYDEENEDLDLQILRF